MLTVAVPRGGLLAPTFAVNCCQTPKSNAQVVCGPTVLPPLQLLKPSSAAGLVLMTSHTAVAVPLITGNSAIGVAPLFTVAVAALTGTTPLPSESASLASNTA